MWKNGRIPYDFSPPGTGSSLIIFIIRDAIKEFNSQIRNVQWVERKQNELPNVRFKYNLTGEENGRASSIGFTEGVSEYEINLNV